VPSAKKKFLIKQKPVPTVESLFHKMFKVRGCGVQKCKIIHHHKLLAPTPPNLPYQGEELLNAS
jgi:hypothetical protein